MRRKMAFMFCTVLIIAIFVSACSEGSNKNKANSGTITISIGEDDYGARMTNYEYAFKMLNEELKAAGEEVEVVANILPKVGDDELVLQAQAGTYRDISMNSSVDIGWELDAGLIQSIDWLKESEVFKSLPENLWNVMIYDGHVYGAIQDMDASPLYVNAAALKKLGWSDADIKALPDRVLKGDFTIFDMLDIAGEAVQKKVTKYGLGCDGLDNICIQNINNQVMGFEPYDIDNNKTIIDKQGMIDTYEFWKKALDAGAVTKDLAALEDVGFDHYIKGEIMFFIGGTGAYNKMNQSYGKTLQEFEDWFYANNTFTLIPAGKKGGKPGSLANPRLYYVSSKVDEDKMPYVQRIIELAMSPAQQIDHTVASGKLPVTRAAQDDPRFKENKFLQDVAYMLDYTGVRSPHLGYPNFRDMYKKGIELILIKGSSAEEAYDLFINNFKGSVEDDQVTYQ